MSIAAQKKVKMTAIAGRTNYTGPVNSFELKDSKTATLFKKNANSRTPNDIEKCMIH